MFGRLILILAVSYALSGCVNTAADSASVADRSPTTPFVALAVEDLPLADKPADYVDAVAEITRAEWCVNAASEAASARIAGAIDRTSSIENSVDRANALVTVLQAMAGKQAASDAEFGALAAAIGAIEDTEKRWDLHSKHAATLAQHGRYASAMRLAGNMPSGDGNVGSFKARGYHDIAIASAKRLQATNVDDALARIQSGITYYQASARSQAAAALARGGEDALQVERLLREADAIARRQTDGYFAAGTLRRIGDAYALSGALPTAMDYFEDATRQAETADAAQKRARAISRVATALADHGQYSAAAALLPSAVGQAEEEQNAALKAWAYYEIAGSAAFAGEFDLAGALLLKIPKDLAFTGKSLQAATRRDIAWGLARHGQTEAARSMAASIAPARERIQAYSRIGRVLCNPAMIALPRYL